MENKRNSVKLQLYGSEFIQNGQTDSVSCTVATAAGTFDFYFPPFRENQHIFVDIPGRMFSSSEKRNAGKISFLS